MSGVNETCRAETISFSILQNIFSKLKLRDYIALASVYNAEEYPASYTYPPKLGRDINCSKATAMRILNHLESEPLNPSILTILGLSGLIYWAAWTFFLKQYVRVSILRWVPLRNPLADFMLGIISGTWFFLRLNPTQFFTSLPRK